ncbi:MAG: 4Fe-4S binding protein [Thiolinea sp.]
MLIRAAVLLSIFFCLFFVPCASAEYVSEERIRSEVIAPYSLGDKTDMDGVWELLNGSGLKGGYVIESEWIQPLPGFSGAPINLFILIDTEGTLVDVRLLNHNEPIFVSGLGEAPFRAFLEQYRGHSINSAITIGSGYGTNSDSGSLVYFDGVTKATASVRIAHESIMAAAREVAKQKLDGLAQPREKIALKDDEGLVFSWDELVEQGIARHVTATHAEVRTKFNDTRWQFDDPFPEAADNEWFADLWIVDVTHPHVARSVMSERMLRDWNNFRRVAPDDETILLIEAGSHGLVGEDFVRNTSPPLITARQDNFPLSIHDADLLIDLQKDVPDGRAMVIRIDRRQGFSPVREWEIGLIATRQRGILNPETGRVELSWQYQADKRFFNIQEIARPPTAFEAAIYSRLADLIILAGLLVLIVVVVLFNPKFVRLKSWPYQRLLLLAMVLGFIGWWGQGQLSIVTPLAALVAMLDGKPLDFLLYDPFSLLIWLLVIISFFSVGRALFCGWLCPFGALQEFIAKIARTLSIPQLKISDHWDSRLKLVKYVVLAGLVAVAVFLPGQVDTAVEVEPFKTAISVFFVREWYFVAYAVLCLLASLVIFKAYCRYLCPLGALMALGGFLQLRKWIRRREDCGSPCQLCKVRCQYQAIQRSGEITYSECFGCLDCVDIYQDKTKCVPLVLQEKGRLKGAIQARKKDKIICQVSR